MYSLLMLESAALVWVLWKAKGKVQKAKGKRGVAYGVWKVEFVLIAGEGRGPTTAFPSSWPLS